MGYRNGTYVAFAGCGTTDPTKSDRKYFETMKMWQSNKNLDFSFSNSHDKTYAVRDSSLTTTLMSRLSERFRESKNILFVITDKTKPNWSDTLEFEVNKASELGLPFLLVYPGYSSILKPQQLESLWPNVLKRKINNSEITAIHFPFKMKLINNSVSRFSIHNDKLKSSLNYYVADFQRD